MVARLCQDQCDVVILEQNETIYSEKHAGGLSLGRWAQKVFDVHIPAPDLLRRTIRSERLSIFTLDDAVMDSLQEEGHRLNDYTQPVIEDHRVAMTTWAAVYRVLLQDIDVVDSELAWNTASKARLRLCTGAKVEDARCEDGRWTITYRSRATNHCQTETADILVAADGAYSTVRRLLLSDTRPTYTGVVAWRGRVPDSVVLDLDKEIRRDLLVWYRMREAQYIILWVPFLQPFDSGILTTRRYAVPVLDSADGNDGAVIEWCWYHPYEEGTDPELEDVMTTFVDQERLLEGKVEFLRAKKWKDRLQRSSANLPRSIWDMLSQCETPWITKVTAADGHDDGTDDEGDSESSDLYMSSLATKPLFAGEAYAKLPPYLGSSLDGVAEHALAIDDFLRGGSDEQALHSWQSDSTARRLRTSTHAGQQGRAVT
jgi:hypothetical protein